mmetsp:Transcript_13451/g.37849  ORF Transcript_13451/g.37849 Transcript_13451/m.37849 type:complete len:274 (-) Transcript_13451:104-925(-)
MNAFARHQQQQQQQKQHQRRSGQKPSVILFLSCVSVVFGLLSYGVDAFSYGTTLASGIRSASTGAAVEKVHTSTHTSVQRHTGGRLDLFGFDKSDVATTEATPTENDDKDDDITGSNDVNKFDMAQRIESLKSVVLGALAGGFSVTPVAYLHYVFFASGAGSTAQWEFATDMSSLEAALFAIVYRYAVRANDNNPMLNQGVVGAFVVVRTLSNIRVTDTCQSIPLRCGPPLGYFDWNMIEQALWGGLESAVLFGAASLAMEVAFKQKWISKFD